MSNAVVCLPPHPGLFPAHVLLEAASFLENDPEATRGLFNTCSFFYYSTRTGMTSTILIETYSVKEFTLTKALHSRLVKPTAEQHNSTKTADKVAVARYWGCYQEGIKDAVAKCACATEDSLTDLTLYTEALGQMSLTPDRSFVIFQGKLFLPSRISDFIAKGFKEMRRVPLDRRAALLHSFFPVWRSLPRNALETLTMHSLRDPTVTALLKREGSAGVALPVKTNYADTSSELSGSHEWMNTFALLSVFEGTCDNTLNIVRPPQLGKFSLAPKQEDLFVERAFREQFLKCATFDERLGLIKATIGSIAYSKLLSDALKMACRTGYLTLVNELLLPKYKTALTATHLLCALTEAFDNEEVDVVRAFVASPRFTEIPALKLDNLSFGF